MREREELGGKYGKYGRYVTKCIRAGGSREELSFYGLPGAMTPQDGKKKRKWKKEKKKKKEVADIGFSAYQRGYWKEQEDFEERSRTNEQPWMAWSDPKLTPGDSDLLYFFFFFGEKAIKIGCILFLL
jgi:hypothetical protein